MDSVTPTPTCYTRFERCIRTTYRKIGDVGGSISGRIALSCLAEYLGLWAGEYVAGKATACVEDASSSNPYETRTVLASMGVVVLCGVVQNKRYQCLIKEQNSSLAVGLVGVGSAVYGIIVWNYTQLFPYMLCVTQMAGRILGGYAGLRIIGFTTSTGAPSFYEKNHWRSCYPMRAMRLEIVSLGMTPRTVASFSMQLLAYHEDWLVPFAKNCFNEIYADKQIVPLLVAEGVINLANQKRKEKHKYIEETSKAFSKSLKESLMTLLAPIYYLTSLGKITLSTHSKSCQQQIDQLVHQIDQSMKRRIQKGVGIEVNQGKKPIEDNSELFVRWGLRTLVRFGRFVEKSDEIKKAHVKWKEAFLDRRDNDQARARMDLNTQIDYVLGKIYPGYRVLHQVIQKICCSQKLAKKLANQLKEIPNKEKQLLGFSLSKPLHISYWEGVCDVYLSRLLTVACLHSRELSERTMRPLEDKKLMQYIETFVCHAYLNVVFSKQSHPWIHQGACTTASIIQRLSEKLLYCLLEPEETWVDVKDDLDDEKMKRDDGVFCIIEAAQEDEDYVFVAGKEIDKNGTKR